MKKCTNCNEIRDISYYIINDNRCRDCRTALNNDISDNAIRKRFKKINKVK